jgi:hypothetical protein
MGCLKTGFTMYQGVAGYTLRVSEASMGKSKVAHKSNRIGAGLSCGLAD